MRVRPRPLIISVILCVLGGVSIIGMRGFAESREDLLMLGRNARGEPIQARMDPYRYQRKLHRSVTDIVDSTLPALEQSATKTKNWELQLLTIGIGLDAQAGVGPFKMGIQPGVRAFFTNVENPPPLP